MKKITILVCVIAFFSSCASTKTIKTTENPYENYGKVHNEVVQMILKDADKNLTANSTTEEVLNYVLPMVEKSLSNKRLQEKYKLDVDITEVNKSLKLLKDNPTYFQSSTCRTCPDWEKMIDMLPTFPEYDQIIPIVENPENDTPEKVVSKLQEYEKAIISNSNYKNRKEILIITAIAKNSVLNAEKIEKQYASACCPWRDIGVTDLNVGVMASGFGPWGMLGGAIGGSAVHALGAYFKW